MNVSEIFKLAQHFERLASIKSNMAKRIFFGLLSHLAPNESAMIHLTKGVVDYNALRQLVSGAKELLKYGIKACVEENEHNERDTKEEFARIRSLYETNQYSECLKALAASFKKDIPGSGFGDVLWAKIAETLLQINESLIAAQNARKDGDWDKEVDSLKDMSIFMNVLDGLAHNSGMFMDKVLDIEDIENPRDWDEEDLDKEVERALEHKRQVKRLMDLKELRDPHQTLQELLPILEKETDAPLTMKDWVQRARRNVPRTDPAEIEQKLKRIRKKKELMARLNKHHLDQSKSKLSSWLAIPDNKAADQLDRNITVVSELGRVIKDITHTYNDLLTEEQRKMLYTFYVNISKYTSVVLRDMISNYKYYDLRKVLQYSLYIVSYLLGIPETITAD